MSGKTAGVVEAYFASPAWVGFLLQMNLLCVPDSVASLREGMITNDTLPLLPILSQMIFDRIVFSQIFQLQRRNGRDRIQKLSNFFRCYYVP